MADLINRDELLEWLTARNPEVAAKIISDSATLFKILDDSDTYRVQEWPDKTFDLLADIERRIKNV